MRKEEGGERERGRECEKERGVGAGGGEGTCAACSAALLFASAWARACAACSAALLCCSAACLCISACLLCSTAIASYFGKFVKQKNYKKPKKTKKATIGIAKCRICRYVISALLVFFAQLLSIPLHKLTQTSKKKIENKL